MEMCIRDRSSYEAAQKLAQDFGIDPDKPPAAAVLPKPERPLLTAYRQEEVRCLRVLCDYCLLYTSILRRIRPLSLAVTATRQSATAREPSARNGRPPRNGAGTLTPWKN